MTAERILLYGLLPTVLISSTPLAAQEDEEIAFVRDWVGYRVVPEFAPNPNVIETLHDYCLDWQNDISDLGDPCENRSPYGVEYDNFISMLATAYAEGRGGVINFETPILGPTYRSADRRDYRAFIEQFQLDNPVEAFEVQVREENPGISDEDALALATWEQQQAGYAAAEEALLDEADVIPVVARGDRSLTDTVDRPINESLLTNDLIGFYGPNQNIPLVISRGDRSYPEGQLATYNHPAPWDLGSMINSEFFPTIGISSYSGGNAYRPTSGINTFNHGMHDMRFDPRDNVKVVGFVHPNYGNFQYYQGESGVPNNPNNIRVVVEFSNGVSEEFAETSGQDTGLWDTFFAFQAPEGASITRVWIRVKGQNWRTFVALDDVAFITEPAPSYIAGDTEFTGSQGEAFYEILQIGQNPESVTLSNLPAGLTYDAGARLISGTFEEAGTFTATATLTNAVDTVEETLTFVVGEPIPADESLDLDPIAPVNVVLRRSLPEITITSSLDDDLPAGSISYFTLVEKILDDGSRVPSSLDFLGLTLRDNLLFGTPGEARQIGNYEVQIFARTESSAASETFQLSVLAPTLSPNFDSNGTTDFAVRENGSLKLAINPASPGDYGTVPLSQALASIPDSTELFPADLNGDNQTDFLAWDSAARTVRQYLSLGTGGGFEETLLLEEVAANEEIVAVNDYNGDGTSDVFWRNDRMNRISIWLMNEGRISWAGVLAFGDLPGLPVLKGDFAGDGRLMHLYALGNGQFALQQYQTYTSLGDIQYADLRFTMDPAFEPVLAADFSNDGRADIVWVNEETGEATLWLMNGVQEETPYFSGTETGQLEGLPGESLLPFAFDWSPITAVDLNNDQFADLLLRNRNTGAMGVLFMRMNQSVGSIRYIGAADSELVAVGDYDGNTVNDLLIRDSMGNEMTILSIDAEGDVIRTSYGQSASGAEWLTGITTSNDTTAIGVGFEWLGTYTYVSPDWIYGENWGYLSPVAVSENSSGWYYDPGIGHFWTSPTYFPYVFQSRNGFWLRYVVGSMDPKWFYNSIFGFYMAENEL